jgi:hypothetical protein
MPGRHISRVDGGGCCVRPIYNSVIHQIADWQHQSAPPWRLGTTFRLGGVWTGLSGGRASQSFSTRLLWSDGRLLNLRLKGT